MGLVGGLTQLTPEELERVRRDPTLFPDLEHEISEMDASRYCYLDKAWHGVHFLLVGDAGPEDRPWVLPLYLAISASAFIASAMLAQLLRVRGGATAISGLLYRALGVIGPLSAVAFIVSSALWLKASGIRRLKIVFSRKRMREPAFVSPEAIRKVMLGGTPMTDSEDLSAYYATPEEVRALAPLLASLHDAEIRRRFDAARMRMLGIYIFKRDADEASFDYALDYLHQTIACYQDAARRGNAVVFSYG